MDGYYLIHKDQNYEDYQISLNEIPAGKYKYIQFALGVDPARNLSIDNVGDLDPNNQMAWNWNTGYKFLLFEGLFTDESDMEKPLVFHIGADPNYQTYQFELEEPLNINSGKNSSMVISADVAQLFKEPNTIDFNSTNTVKHSPEASQIGANYGNNLFEVNLAK
jgi:hypothetical protein